MASNPGSKANNSTPLSSMELHWVERSQSNAVPSIANVKTNVPFRDMSANTDESKGEAYHCPPSSIGSHEDGMTAGSGSLEESY